MTVFADGLPKRHYKRQPKRFFIDRNRTVSRARFAASAMAFIAAYVGLISIAHAQSTSLLTNGNFEAGSFAGWTRSTVSSPSDATNSRNFTLSTPGTTTPSVNGVTFNTAINNLSGGGGSYYAVSVSDYPGQSALLQAFITPTVASGNGLRLTLTFDWFVNDQSGYSNTMQDSSGLDYTTGGLSSPRSNQFARVDLIKFSSSDFSTSASDVLFNIPLTVPTNAIPNSSPNPYQRASVDLSPYVQANTQYKIRFAEVDNLSALNFGVDNVGIQADITPEPATLALALPFLGIAPALFARSRRTAKSRKAKKD